MSDREWIERDGKPLAFIIRGSVMPDKTTFLTPNEFKLLTVLIKNAGKRLQAIVRKKRKGGEIKRHVHLPLERHLVGTSEVLIVKTGRAEIDIYDDDRVLVATRELRTGDIMLMVGGGHGFRMIEDTVFLEIKQGPYTGIDEKERF